MTVFDDIRKNFGSISEPLPAKKVGRDDAARSVEGVQDPTDADFHDWYSASNGTTFDEATLRQPREHVVLPAGSIATQDQRPTHIDS